jgi:hypothetical protein
LWNILLSLLSIPHLFCFQGVESAVGRANLVDGFGWSQTTIWAFLEEGMTRKGV